MARDYRKEYDEYHGTKEQKENRAARNKARSDLGLEKGDGMEADHINPLSKGGGNGEKNLRAVKRSTNRKKAASKPEAKVAEYDELMGELKTDAQKLDACPKATQDLDLNLENRQVAIDEKRYGPANPAQDEGGGNSDFWQEYADRFSDTVENVMTMRCAGCTFFDTTEDARACIAEGIGDEADPEQAVVGGDLGYCQALDFKCASQRVCIVWAGRQE